MHEGDEVTRIFHKMRAEVDGMLRRHEKEVRQAMSAAPTQRPSETSPTGQAEEAPGSTTVAPVNTSSPFRTMRTRRSLSSLGTRGEDSVRTTRKSHWTNQMKKDREGESKVQIMLERCEAFKDSVLDRLPILVDEESTVARMTRSKYWTVLRSFVLFFDAMIVVFDVANSSSKAKEMNWQGSIPDVTLSVVCTDIFFAFCFLDLLFQFIIEFPRFDFVRGRTGYRWFNILVTVEQFFQVVGQHAQPNQRTESMFRVVVTQLAVVRLLRACIVLPEIAAKLELGVQELRVMIRSLMGAFQPLLWCTTPFVVMLTTFGVFTAEGTLVWLMKNEENTTTHKEVVAYFGTFDLTLLSLYKALLGGMDWGDLYTVMLPLEGYLRISFLCFVCFNFIAMLNIVAAVFIKVAFLRSESDKQFLIQKEMEAKQGYLETMADIFNQLDEDNDGRINLSELQRHLDTPNIGAYFSKLGVDVNEVEKLFTLLDEDGSGNIDSDEFMFGCLRLKGEAKSLDLAILQREVDALKNEVIAHHTMAKQAWSKVQVSDNNANFTTMALQSSSGNNHPQTADLAMFKLWRQEMRNVTDGLKDLSIKVDNISVSPRAV